MTSQPAVLRAEQPLARHHHVVEEDLVELVRAGHGRDRSHGDAGRRHVEEEHADPRVLGRVGVGAGEQQAPVGGRVGVARPDLLPVHDEVVAVVVARVRSDARSDPASGSENSCVHSTSPRAIGGRNSARWSGVPNRMMSGPM